jgi:hypothetical protein
MSKPTIELIPYAGWPNCYRFSDGVTELVVTTDVGPRVIRYGFVGGQNMFVEIAEQLGKSGESSWEMRGGHRLWAGPETKPDTYALDNGPVEPETGLQKEIILSYEALGGIKVTHCITNRGTRARSLAPWALTQMAQGGTAIAAFPPRGGHSEQLLPTNPLVMWAYTNFADPRWQFAGKYLILRQDPSNSSPQKTGLFNVDTRAAYLLGSDLFVKSSQGNAAATYPDFHCCFEIFTNGDFLELETLGPLTELVPGATATHVERWSVQRDIVLKTIDEAEIDRVIQPFF